MQTMVIADGGIPVPADLRNRVKYCDLPFAYIIYNYKVETYCSYCLRKPKLGNLQFCGQCKFARYCDKTCQKGAWKEHRTECTRLQSVFPNLPLSEVLFLARIWDKLQFIKQHGDVKGWYKHRKFDDLLSHEDEIKADEVKMKDFDRVFGKFEKFLGSECPSKTELFPIYCRVWINSHSVHDSSSTEIGMAMDLEVSKYDHCCRPNVSLLFDGCFAIIRPLTPEVNVNDTTKAFISYIDVGRSRYQRRQELKAKWYFWCECERCMDPEDDRLTSFKCANAECKEPLITTEDTEPKEMTCKSCGTVSSKERCAAAQQTMLSIPTRFLHQADGDTLKQKLDEAQAILHSENIYYSRLLTAFLNQAGVDQYIHTPEQHRLVYQNYTRVFPKADRHVGYQLLNLVRSLIEEDRRSEAVTYAYEAMTIFEVCFGLEHPYYLQTLALWTYLDNKSNKSKKDLLSLLNFDDNRPVDLTSLLAKAEALATEHNNEASEGTPV